MSDYLCEELIIEIFTRLPTKSLLRFRSLSKSVCSFIDSPSFIRKHTFHDDQYPQKAMIIREKWRDPLLENYTLLSEDRLPLCPVHGYIDVTTLEFPGSLSYEIVGSCNGILCLFSKNNKTICLWNPSIRRELTMRDRPSRGCNGYNVELGFGFDSVSKDYKILRISYSWDNTELTSSFVYSMETDSWRKIDSPTIPFNKVVSKACFVNGKFHWVVECDDTSCELAHTYILTFDLGTNTYGSIQLPEPDKGTQHLTHINGSLSVMYTDGDDCCIWVRREHDNTANWHAYHTNIYGVKKMLGLKTNGNFVLIISISGYKVHNLETGGESRLVKFKTSNSDADRYGATGWETVFDSLVLCNDSLELLITGTAYKGTQVSFLQKKK